MGFRLDIAIISFVVGIIISMIVIPILKKLKVGQIERQEGPQSHLKKQGTPTMGGIIMIITLIIVVLIEIFFFRGLQKDYSVTSKMIPLVLLTIGFGIVGLVDDIKKLIFKNTDGLKPLYKMAGLLIISVAFTLYLTQVLKIGTETYIPFVKQYITLPIWFYIPFVIFVMLGTTNAVNLTDGVDGLATTVSTIIITALTVISMMLGVEEVAQVGAILIGTCLAFLIFNLHPAKVIMGDTGSLLLGGLISGMALYLKMPLILVIIALVPVIETVSVMIQVVYFRKTGKRIFKMTPIHHHFELCGWNENVIVSVFSIVTLILSIIAFKVI